MMPQFRLKAKNDKVVKQIERALKDTVILQRQKQLTYGRWDFVVFGPVNKNEIMIRVGFAEHSTISRAPLYIATLGKSDVISQSGVPIEEFLEEDVPKEYEGLEIYQIDPMRPLKIKEKSSISGHLTKKVDSICRQYENENIALIQSPRETDWGISVMKYLHECDRDFPDMVLETFHRKMGNHLKGIKYNSPDNIIFN